MAEQLTPAQADRIETEYRRMKEHALGFGEFVGTAMNVLRETSGRDPYWPYGWEPPDKRAKAKGAGA